MNYVILKSMSNVYLSVLGKYGVKPTVTGCELLPHTEKAPLTQTQTCML